MLSEHYTKYITSILTRYANTDIETNNHLFELFKLKKIKKGQSYLQHSNLWETFTLVVKGMFRLYYIDESGREHTKGLFYDDQVMAPCAPSVIGYPVNFSIETIEDTEVLSADYGNMRTFLESTTWGQYVLIGLLETVLNEKVEREHDWLNLDAEARYLRFLSRCPDLSGRLPLYIIANFLGMTDVTLSRLRKKLDLT